MFDIGDKVEWASGNIKSRGLIYGDNSDGEFIEVLCCEVNNRKSNFILPVLKSVLQKVN